MCISIINSASKSSLGKNLIAGLSSKNQLKIKFIFDKTNGGHVADILSLAALEDGYLATSDFFGVIKVWDIIQGKLKYTFNSTNGGHTSLFRKLVAFENGYFVSASDDADGKFS